MTDFAVQTTIRAAAPLVSKEKGSIGNRLDCAGQQLKNDAVTLAQTGVTLGTATIAGTGIAKNDAVAKVFSQIYDSGVRQLERVFGSKVGNTAHKLEQKLHDIVGTFMEGQAMQTGKTTSGKTKTAGKLIKNVVSSYKVVNKIKGFAVLAAITLPVLAYITHKGSYKSGQIDQKYTDRAQTQTLTK